MASEVAFPALGATRNLRIWWWSMFVILRLALPAVWRKAAPAALLMILPAAGFADTARNIGQFGSWAVFIATDPMTDDSWYGARAMSNAGADVQVDCTPQRPQKLNVPFHTKEFLGDGFRDVVYRVDSKAPHTVTGSYSDNSVWPLCDGACKGDGKSQPEVTWANDVVGGTRLLVRLKTFRYEYLDFSFPINGAREAFGELLKGCGNLAAERNRQKP